VKRLTIGIIRLYQKCLSPIFGRHCRFTPTCSEYMIDAIKAKGLLKGVCLGIWRILRCNPFNPGGYDPVERAAVAQPPLTAGKINNRDGTGRRG
jgi:putative membrane protein insertion efficiency factor